MRANGGGDLTRLVLGKYDGKEGARVGHQQGGAAGGDITATLG